MANSSRRRRAVRGHGLGLVGLGRRRLRRRSPAETRTAAFAGGGASGSAPASSFFSCRLTPASVAAAAAVVALFSASSFAEASLHALAGFASPPSLASSTSRIVTRNISRPQSDLWTRRPPPPPMAATLLLFRPEAEGPNSKRPSSESNAFLRSVGDIVIRRRHGGGGGGGGGGGLSVAMTAAADEEETSSAAASSAAAAAASSTSSKLEKASTETADGEEEGENDQNEVEDNDEAEAEDDLLPPALVERGTEPLLSTEDLVDVSALKRNLVQRAVSEYKKELLDLLRGGGGSGGAVASRSRLIEEKLAAIAQANPVSTTTDSNLLEGEWEFVFSSASLSAQSVLDPTRWEWNRRERQRTKPTPPSFPPRGSDAKKKENDGGSGGGNGWRLPSSSDRRNPFKVLRRTFRLGEDLTDDEDPCVTETVLYLNGLWTVRKTYRVVKLSRTSLELELRGVTVKAAGRRWEVDVIGAGEDGEAGALGKWRRGIPRYQSLRMFYLDNDLCISTATTAEASSSSSLDGRQDPPLRIYTRRVGEGAPGMLQYAKSAAFYLWSIESPLRFRRKVGAAFSSPMRWIKARRQSPTKASSEVAASPAVESYVVEDEENRVVVRRTGRDARDGDEEYRLLVLKLGEYGINADGTLREDEAWDGEEDPFVHLTPEERAEKMRTMKIGEIVAAGKEKKRKEGRKGNRRRRRPWNQQKFVRPNARERGDGSS